MSEYISTDTYTPAHDRNSNTNEESIMITHDIRRYPHTQLHQHINSYSDINKQPRTTPARTGTHISHNRLLNYSQHHTASTSTSTVPLCLPPHLFTTAHTSSSHLPFHCAHVIAIHSGGIPAPMIPAHAAASNGSTCSMQRAIVVARVS